MRKLFWSVMVVLALLGMLLLSEVAYANAEKISIIVNGQEIIPDVAPQLITGRTMVPARYIAEPLGATVEWDAANNAVIIYESEKPPVSPAASSGADIRIFINGQEIKPDVAPQNVNGRIMVPARFIAEPLGAGISWDGQGKKVIVNKRDIEGVKSSNQLVTPFNPTDVFVFALPDWNNKNDLAVAQKTHAAVVGSSHGENDINLEKFFDNSEALSKVTAIAHEAGLKYTAHFTTGFSDITFPDESKVAIEDIDGNIILDSMPTETQRVSKSIHYTRLKNYMIDMAKKAVNSGVDIICIDTWTLNYDVVNGKGGDFSENSLAGFRGYLKNKYSAAQLSSFKISDINSFDYGAYIKNNYLNDYKHGDKQKIPLFNDFLDFQLISCKNFWRDIVNETRKYAEANNKKVVFTVNVPESGYTEMIHGLPIVDLVDGFMSEYRFELPPYNNTISEYKLFRSMGKPIAFLPNCGFSVDLLARKDLAELMRLYTAEAYASGEFTYVPFAEQVNSSAGWELYSADMSKMYPYYDFISGNGVCYDNLVSPAKTAVLYSYASVKNNRPSSSNFFGICNLLLDAHRQYDALFAGDNQWIDDNLTLGQLNQYDLVVLPNIKDISDKQLDLLLTYVRTGGKVFAFGETATRDESDFSKPRTQLNGLLVEGSHQYGLGQFVYEKDEVGAKYSVNRDGTLRQQVDSMLNAINQEDIQTNASTKVSMLEYWNVNAGAGIVHLINYDYDTSAQHFNTQSNISMDVSLNSKLLGKELGVFYISPDWSEMKELNYTINNNKISFVIPNLETYSVIFIGEKDKFQTK